MGNESPKETPVQETGLMGWLAKLSAAGLLILGALYIMGYVVVNGYQAKYLSYSANALQLKHLAAGLLYLSLTSFQVVAVAIFILLALTDLVFPSKPKSTEKKPTDENEPLDAQKRTDKERPQGSLDRTKEFLYRLKSYSRYPLAIYAGVFLPYVLLYLFLKFVGVSFPPTRPGAQQVLVGMLPWLGINLVLSIVIAAKIYLGGSKRFESAMSKKPDAKKENSERTSAGNEVVSTFELQQLRRRFIEADASRVGQPVLAFVLLLFSLSSFQGLYGRLKPDYGGGALCRVAMHLKSSGSLPADLKAKLQSNDSWLFLVDKDGTFVYVLRVERNGIKQLLEISQGEIEALEILSTPPISPADAPLFMQ